MKNIYFNRWEKNLMGFLFCIFPLFLNCELIKDWKTAQAKGTIFAYQDFYEKHPKSIFATRAVNEIWRLTEKENDFDYYDFFIVKHPKSPYTEKALDKVWEIAVKEDKIEIYEKFLAERYLISVSPKIVDRAIRSELAIQRIFQNLVPKKPSCKLESDLSVSVDWDLIYGATSYKIYWSLSNWKEDLFRKKAKFEKVSKRYFRYDPETKRFPVYFRISGLRSRDGSEVETKLSDECVARLLSSYGGTRCQICGAKAYGYCHLRGIYVCEDHRRFGMWICP